MARHYHSAWWKVASFALLNGTFFLTSLICSSGGHSSIGNIAYAGWMGLLAYPVFYALLIAQTERVIRRKVALQGGALTPVDYRYILAQVPALLIHLAAAASAMIRRHVSWRGVAYQVSRGGHVRILRDEPLLVRLDRDRQTSIV